MLMDGMLEAIKKIFYSLQLKFFYFKITFFERETVEDSVYAS
jgi:hypothetical protein